MDERRLQVVWMVGVRNRTGKRRYFSPTSREWFSTRKECENYIKEQIFPENWETYTYKPMKYLPVRP